MNARLMELREAYYQASDECRHWDEDGPREPPTGPDACCVRMRETRAAIDVAIASAADTPDGRLIRRALRTLARYDQEAIRLASTMLTRTEATALERVLPRFSRRPGRDRWAEDLRVAGWVMLEDLREETHDKP